MSFGAREPSETKSSYSPGATTFASSVDETGTCSATCNAIRPPVHVMATARHSSLINTLQHSIQECKQQPTGQQIKETNRGKRVHVNRKCEYLCLSRINYFSRATVSNELLLVRYTRCLLWPPEHEERLPSYSTRMHAHQCTHTISSAQARGRMLRPLRGGRLSRWQQTHANARHLNVCQYC